MEADLHEKLARVDVRFEAGRVDPLALRWGRRDLRVRAIQARWVDRAVRPPRFFFSVTVETGETLVLSHREGEPVWYVERVFA
jgi:hypothetical protein